MNTANKKMWKLTSDTKTTSVNSRLKPDLYIFTSIMSNKMNQLRINMMTQNGWTTTKEWPTFFFSLHSRCHLGICFTGALQQLSSISTHFLQQSWIKACKTIHGCIPPTTLMIFPPPPLGKTHLNSLFWIENREDCTSHPS